jgi:hypothetical protein
MYEDDFGLDLGFEAKHREPLSPAVMGGPSPVNVYIPWFIHVRTEAVVAVAFGLERPALLLTIHLGTHLLTTSECPLFHGYHVASSILD